MCQYILVIISLIMIMLNIYNFIVREFRRMINLRKVKNIVFKFESKTRYTSLLAAFVLTMYSMTMVSYKYKVLYEITGKKLNIVEFILGSFNDKATVVLTITFITIFIIDVFTSTYTKSIMYEDGILCSDGLLINWKNIKSISCNKSYDKRKRVINIRSNRDENIQLVLNERECEIIKEIIFNKTGIISKDIITELS